VPEISFLPLEAPPAAWTVFKKREGIKTSYQLRLAITSKTDSELPIGNQVLKKSHSLKSEPLQALAPN
jgi:hypothetical protein